MRVVYMGTGDIGLPALNRLLVRSDCDVVAVVTQPDRPAGRQKRLKSPEVKAVASRAGVPVFQPERLRKSGTVDALADLAPDLIVVMAYGQILPREVLDLPRAACLNLHASLLPRHRGAAPIQAAILAGDLETGITVMYMAEGLDTGDILLMESTAIGPRETAGELHDRLADLAAVATDKAIDLIASGAAPRIPQNDSQATYAGKLTRTSGVIDWSNSAVAVDCHVRAMNPWPAASTLFPLTGGATAKLKVFSVESVDGTGSAGTVLAAGVDGLVVAAGVGAVRVTEVQGEGGRRMPATAWCRGHDVRIGGVCL